MSLPHTFRSNVPLSALALLCVLAVVACSDPASGSRDAASDGDATSISGDANSRLDGVSNSDATGIDGLSGDASTRDATSSDLGSADAAACTPLPGTIPYSDHVSNEEFTDPPSCSGCPGTFMGTGELDVGMLSPGATTVSISGSSAGASRCEFYVIGGSCGVTHGNIATDPDGGGQFQTTVPVFCGTNIVRIVCHSSAGARVLVRRLEGTQCTGGGRDLRVTLTWDDQGSDMELHLLRAAGRINNSMDDCTWFTCMSPSGLDWGVVGDSTDNPRKDIDNTGFFGPENIYLDRAPAGIYHVLVEYWATGSPSTLDVDVTIRERTVARLHRAAFQVHNVWYLGTVAFPSAIFTPVDSTTDCAASWRATTMGCDLPLPP